MLSYLSCFFHLSTVDSSVAGAVDSDEQMREGGRGGQLGAPGVRSWEHGDQLGNADHDPQAVAGSVDKDDQDQDAGDEELPSLPEDACK